MALTQADLTTIPPNGIDPQEEKYQLLLNDLQGNILRGHGRNYSVHLFLQFTADTDEQKQVVKQWIKSFAEQYVTSAKKQSDDAQRYREENISGGVFANFFLSMFGYLKLGFDYSETPNDTFFRAGMKDLQNVPVFGDPPPQSWEVGFQNEIHALVLMADDDLVGLLQKVNRVQNQLPWVIKIVQREDGFILRNKVGQIIEHFGFVDGISQPLFLQRDIAKARKNYGDFEKWDPRAPLNLLLVKDPNGQTEDSYGSYLIYRKLEQNVKDFRADQRQLATKLGISEDLAGAYVVGRFYDGTPVTLANSPSYTSISIFEKLKRWLTKILSGRIDEIEPPVPTNNFNYAEDMKGSRCPFHAHIRKTNPRGDTGRIKPPDVPLEEERMHRIARRGIIYGENNPQAEPETGSGLLFLSFQGDIMNQMAVLQTLWANDKNFIKPKLGTDPFIGHGGAFPVGCNKNWPKQWNQDEAGTEPFNFKLWVRLRGGESFFAPSISFLKSLG